MSLVRRPSNGASFGRRRGFDPRHWRLFEVNYLMDARKNSTLVIRPSDGANNYYF
jgi:hypothetical protein